MTWSCFWIQVDIGICLDLETVAQLGLNCQLFLQAPVQIFPGPSLLLQRGQPEAGCLLRLLQGRFGFPALVLDGMQLCTALLSGPQRLKSPLDAPKIVRPGRVQTERQHGLQAGGADEQHAQPMAVLERKARIGLADLVPETPHAKVVSSDLGIVKQHNAPLRQFGQPDLEVVADGFVGVQTIDVQKVNAGVCEVDERFVKGLSQQC